MPTLAERMANVEQTISKFGERLATVEAVTMYLKGEVDRATASRAKLHEKLDDVLATTSGLAHNVARILPLVEQHQEFIQQARGEQRLMKRFWIVGGKIAGWLAAILAPVATWLHWDTLAAWLGRLSK